MTMTTPSINTTPALFVLDPGAAESHHPAAPLPTSQDFVGAAQPYADEADQSRQLQQILAASNLTVDHNDTNDSISHQTITTTVRKTGETPVPSALTTRDPVSDGNSYEYPLYADEADQSRQLQQILAASNLTVDHNDTNDSISHQTITTTVRKTGETPVPSALTTRDPVSDGNLQRVTVSSSVTSTSRNALTGPEQGISLEDGLTTFVRSRSSVPPNVPPLVAGTPLELLSAQNSLMKADPPSSTPPYERPWSGRVSKPPPSSLYATVVAPSQRAPTLTAPNSRDHAVTIPPSLLTPFLSPRSGSKSSLSIKQGSHTSRLNYNLHSSSSRHSGGVNDTPHGHVSASSRTVGQTSQRRSYSVQSPRTFGALSVLPGIETHRVTETARVRTLSTSSSTEHVAYYLHKPVLGYDVDSTLKAMYLQEYRNDREMLGLFSRNESMEQDYRNICRVRKRSTKRSQSTKSQNKEEKIFERLYRVVPDRYRNVVKTNQERLMKAREMVQKPGTAPILWKR